MHLDLAGKDLRDENPCLYTNEAVNSEHGHRKAYAALIDRKNKIICNIPLYVNQFYICSCICILDIHLFIFANVPRFKFLLCLPLLYLYGRLLSLEFDKNIEKHFL